MSSLVKPVTRRSMNFYYSGRSSDYISPSFGYGCLADCKYCYMKRRMPKGLSYAKNTDQILTEIFRHSQMDAVMHDDFEKPNQVHETDTMYDISCNEDFILHLKYYDWQRIFSFFGRNEGIAATLATKFAPMELLTSPYRGNKSVRIRMSLMPQRMSTIMEPNTSPVIDRMRVIPQLIEKGYDVHVNFSPVIMYEQWHNDYKMLFEQLDFYVPKKFRDTVKAEVIFLTHEDGKHQQNLADGFEYEHLLWQPSIQEYKMSQLSEHKNNAKPAIRYRRDLKARFQDLFVELHNSIIPWNTIRYIF